MRASSLLKRFRQSREEAFSEDPEVLDDFERTRQVVEGWVGQPGKRLSSAKTVGIVSFTNFPMHAKFQCLAAKAMEPYGFRPLIFTQASARLAKAYFELFEFDEFVFWREEEDRLDRDEVEENVRRPLPEPLEVTTLISVKFRGVEVGKHALSATCRKLIEGRLDPKNPGTASLLRDFFRKAVQSVMAAERVFDRIPVAALIARDPGYIPNGGIFEVALNRGIDCVVYEQGQRKGTWVFKRYSAETKGMHYFSLSPETWSRVLQAPWTQDDDVRLEQEFAGRYKPDSTDDTRRLMSGKQEVSPEEVRRQIGLDPAKKTAVIFSHIAWDAAYFFGTCLFSDFEDWLFQTVKFVAGECPELNWLIKLHPFNALKLKRENKTEESELRLLRTLMPLPSYVTILRADTGISTRSLFPVVDYVLTVNGTVGMEFPCFGVPAVLAGTGRYNGRGFTMEPQTQEEYFQLLRVLHRVPRLTRDAQLLARRHLFTLLRLRQVSFEDVAPMELKRIDEAQSNVFDNIVINPLTSEEFHAARSIRCLAEWLTRPEAGNDFLDQTAPDPTMASLGQVSRIETKREQTLK